MAQLEGIEEVRLGYERSADEGNGVFVQGLEVNHQFDKSSAFLRAAQEYALLHLTPSGCDASSSDTEVVEASEGVRVVSTLHGLWEIQVRSYSIAIHYTLLYCCCDITDIMIDTTITNIISTATATIIPNTSSTITIDLFSLYLLLVDRPDLLRGSRVARLPASLSVLQRPH